MGDGLFGFIPGQYGADPETLLAPPFRFGFPCDVTALCCVVNAFLEGLESPAGRFLSAVGIHHGPYPPGIGTVETPLSASLFHSGLLRAISVSASRTP